MGQLELRPAGPTDVDAVARIWRDGWAHAHLGNVPDALVDARTPESFDQRARERLGNTTVASLGGTVVGFVMLDRDQVDHLYLDLSARGSGVGAALLRRAERLVTAAGHPGPWLAVATGNTGARRFYERQGWVDEGRFDHEAPVPGGSVVVDCHRFVGPGPEDARVGA
ncbi:GNAT family N-acetyltransferase [Mumia zhuanghuii]|uniref:GNAT family N-acetyltransferase n=1 Tax=Mumia zhuanghuii TaxID=2585211 RepID=A0A5C4LVM2_9ACTN|nr:GNAT family N-acetyltransferase [Mumia zhuanghuii]TNC21999.1 GNAT family N-acetyltransferase [Mumia zhuanghuii]